MKKLFGFLLIGTVLAGCNLSAPTGGGVSGGMREYIVLGGRMDFESCRARGGLIIHDRGSPMVACDPRVIGPVTAPDEFDHPGDHNAPASASNPTGV